MRKLNAIKHSILSATIVALVPMCTLAHTSEIENKLIQAASKGQVSELERLVKAGGVNLKTSCATMAAVRANQIGAVRHLIEHGADPDVSACNGPTRGSAYAAAKLANRELLSYLLAHGADVNAESPTGGANTPLLIAVYYGELDVARLLIEFGASVNRVSVVGGNTPLHQAIRYSGGSSQAAAEFVKLLLKSGADPEIKDGSGITARQFAESLPTNELSVLIEREKPAPSNAVRASAAELGDVMFTLAYKDMCDTKLPGFKDRSELAYKKWASKKAPLITQIKDSSQYKEMIVRNKGEFEKPVHERLRESQAKELQNLCDELFDHFSAADKLALDPELATPEKTWARYIAALRAADRQAVVACLASTARDKFRPLLNQLSDEQLRTMADSIKSFRLTGLKFGDFVEAVATRQDGHGGIIYFQNVNGEWKISDL